MGVKMSKDLVLMWKMKMFGDGKKHRLFSFRRRGREMRFDEGRYIVQVSDTTMMLQGSKVCNKKISLIFCKTCTSE